MDRINVGTGLVAVAVIAALVAIIIWGPADQRGLAASTLIGGVGVLVAAFRGRVLKRSPEDFKPPTDEPPPAVVEERHTVDGGKTWNRGGLT